MEVNIYEAKTNLSKLIQALVDQNEEVINICKNGTPIVQMTLVKKKNKRLGVARGVWEEMSQEEFDSIDVASDFLK